MPYLWYYHMQIFIFTFHVGHLSINYYTISRLVLLADLFFVSEYQY